MDNKVEKIVQAAVRAPSGDNTQPWRLEVSDNGQRIDLYNAPERDPSYFNYRQLASYVAHGALIENLLIAAKSLGRATELTLFPSPADHQHIACFSFADAEPDIDPLYSAIFRRQTDRNRFKATPLSQGQISDLQTAVSPVAGTALTLITAKKQIRRLAWLLRLNDRLVFEHKAIHQFLFKQIRWNPEETESTQDGMPIETLGLNPMERLMFPAFKRWNTVRILNKLALSRIVGLKGWVNCRNSSALGIVTVKENSPQGFLNAGRAVQRVWLQATLDGLAFQPVTGLFFLFQRIEDDKLQGFDEKQIRLIERARKELQQLCGYGNDIPVMGFRIGTDAGQPRYPLTKRMAF